MPTIPRTLLLLLTLGVVTGAAEAAKIRVVASLPDLKALTEEVGGDLVEVDAIARSSQNAHDVELRPSLMAKLRRADLFITNGLELDYWANALAQSAANPRVVTGSPYRIDASRGVPILEVPTSKVDRSMGDIHPQGNPHYTLDPSTAPIVTTNIVEALARVAPGDRPAFERRRKEFLARLSEANARWVKTLEPFKGTRVVTNHNSWIYLLTHFGFQLAGMIEDRPGIPPSPSHLVQLIRSMQQERVKLIILEPWGDPRPPERVAAEVGAKVVVLAHTVGAIKGTETYIGLFDYNVSALANALK